MLTSPATAVLLAAPDVVRAGWLEGLGPVILLLFWVVRQIVTAMGEQKEAERLREEQAERAMLDVENEPAVGGADPAEAPPQGDLRSEVDEFLKRVGQMPEEAPAAAEARAAEAGGMAPPIEETRRRGPIDPFEEPVRRRPPKRQREPVVELILDTEEAEPVPPTPKPARQRVELRHLPESQLAEQAAQLGGKVALSDDRLEARLHEKFDHRLGKLAQKSATPPEEESSEEQETGAARIKALLARPGGVREAVVLSEILRRPADSL